MILNRTKKTVVCKRVEVANSLGSQLKGLMFRKSLEGGFLMVFPKEKKNGIWTFGMRFPIDVAWLERDRTAGAVGSSSRSLFRVVDLVERFCPWRLPRYPRGKARMVLELPAGTLKKTRTGKGDVMEIRGI